jgi:transcriptional regulator with XRE-family HTH domain
VTHRDTPSRAPHPQDLALQRFGATLRAYRQQRGLTQRALAVRTGIRNRYISDIERGRHNISVVMLLRLAQALDIPAAWLLVGLDTYPPVPPPLASDPSSAHRGQEAAVIQDTTAALQRGDAATLLHGLGATLRQYRQHQGLTQKALAASTGLNPTYIGQIEQGHRNLSVLSLVRLAAALGLVVAHLLTPVEPRRSPSSSLPE